MGYTVGIISPGDMGSGIGEKLVKNGARVVVALDARLGDIVAAAGEDANFVVVSDHGFGPLKASVYFNRWLADEGLLTLRPASAAVSRRAWKRALNAIAWLRKPATVSNAPSPSASTLRSRSRPLCAAM